MKRIKRASIVLIAVALVVSLTMILPASAQNGEGNVEVLDSEFVVCTMESTGEIEEVQVFNQLSLDGEGSVTVKEEKAFEDVGGYQGVKSFTKPSVEGDYIVWPEISVDGPANVVAATKLSEAMVEEARTRIPLDVDIKYWFDGEPVTDLETVTGKSGRFKLEMKLTNESKEKTEIEYKDPATGAMVTEEVETYLPMVILPYDWYFNNSTFFNLEADPTGLIVPMPDFYNVGWSIPLFPPATEESHTIWVAADVKDFQMPPLTLAVAFHFPESNQTDVTATLAPYIKAFYDGMVSVNEGIGSPDTDPSLLFGVTAVDSGLQQLAAALPEAKTTLDALLIPGLDTVTNASDQLAGGASVITAGLQGISAGIGSANTEDTLLYAMSALEGGLELIKYTYIGGTDVDGTLLYAANALLGGLSNPTGIPDPGLLEAAQAINAGTTPGTGPIYVALQGIYVALQGIIDDAGELITNYTPMFDKPYGPPPYPSTLGGDPTPAQIKGTAEALQDVAEALQVSICTSVDPDDPSIYATTSQMIAGIGSTSTPETLLYGASALYGGLLGIAEGIGSPDMEDTLLYVVDLVSDNLSLIKDVYIGSATQEKTLLNGMAQIQGGLVALKAGISSGDLNDPGIKEGLILISSGVGTAVEGLGSSGTPDTLLYGSNAVKEGLTELGGGATQLEEGLAAVLTNFSMTGSELEAIAQRGEEFDHFLGRAEDAESEVRFVYQTKPTYNYKTGNSTGWIVAIVLSIIIALLLVAGGILLARRSTA